MPGGVVLSITLAAAAALALAGVALVIALRGRDAEVRRAIEPLEARLEALLEVQRDVPRRLAEEGAIQARSLADVRERLVEVVETARRLEAVGSSVAELRDLLRVPRLRGAAGEVWLTEALAEVLPADAYQVQFAFRTGERVDAVIRLRDRLVPIDAKFPLDAYRRMVGAADDERPRERRTFARSVRARIDEIAEKYIRPEEGTFDFALLYLPAESVYYEAVVRDDADGEGLAAYAQRRNVFLVSPNTLYAYLTAVAHGLRGLAVERYAREILDELGGLAQAFDRGCQIVALAGRHAANAHRQFDDASRLLEDVRDRFRRLTERA